MWILIKDTILNLQIKLFEFSQGIKFKGIKINFQYLKFKGVSNKINKFKENSYCKYMPNQV